ncbi:tRNA (adenine(22)-N(1))-methyltransferase [Streptococcus sp. DD12]|uniref:tRNA (adenine(22)-N(1))-methyltransferase n=1 Tax=Streptococcus sp. DD12 TaxID=1777880 RepID=UPI00079302B5|nr:tRNA (adenine(22)-N(1))-methyltransferase TrmK [Streptococcus sp. DD12]KXT76296.1 putative tRNA-m1A22 methylase [Streptococcus sp. DD12]
MTITLSDRLQAVKTFVPQGARLLDVGSDHAYLPIALIQEGQISYAVAGEVVVGPYEAAKANVQTFGLEKQIVVRLADGLTAFEAEDQLDTISICGMGGGLIAQILEAGKEKLAPVQRLILQPNNREDDVRTWLEHNGFELVAESMVLDHGKFYEILVAQAGQMTLTEQEKRFGPLLSQEKSATFTQRWQRELSKLERALTKIPQENTDDRRLLVQKMRAIEEVLA